MIPELGLFALIIALALTLLQVVFPWLGYYTTQDRFLFLSKPIQIMGTFFICLSFLALLYSFMHDDFSIQYVAKHSNSALPLLYKLSALWGGHEGSLLLWILFLSMWTLIVNIFGRGYPKLFLAQLLAILGLINMGFLIFLLFYSNPFLRELPALLDGADLNPLLQDPGLVFHPPILYVGYVGTAIPFAFAVVALLFQKDIHTLSYKTIAEWVRPYVLASFAFLTLGIAWGSYWAYYELGWGGWWFWDPVENASFMPWISLIALIHTLIALRKRQLLYLWSLLLMILCFALSLLGSFLVRSGVLTSVHAFATDPKRGVFILFLLFIFIGSALLLFAIQGKKILKPIALDLTSREALLFLNSILLVVAVFSILLGTLFPLIMDVLTGKKISVGFPYFNAVFIPIVIPILCSIPLGPFVHFGSNSPIKLMQRMRLTFLISLLTSLLMVLYFPGKAPFFVFLGLLLSFWVILGSLQRLIYKLKEGGIKQVSANAWGMILAHVGIGVLVLGITLVSNFEIERDLRLSPNQPVVLGPYEIIFEKVDTIEGDNYVGYRGNFLLRHHQTLIKIITPEKRMYVVQNMNLSETAIHTDLWSDVYVALGEKLSENEWTVRLYYKPGVRLIWWSALLITLACVILLMKNGARK